MSEAGFDDGLRLCFDSSLLPGKHISRVRIGVTAAPIIVVVVTLENQTHISVPS
jgi:hypothetical protein